MEKSKDYLQVEFCNDGVFVTNSGILVNILHPTPQMIEIEDIAHALSNICRYGGHSKKFYSVAQHSLFVCLLAPKHLKKEALLHDAAEAYTGDVVKPLKVILGEKYECIEAGFMRAISARFGLNASLLPLVKKYDMMAYDLETEWLRRGNATPIMNAVKDAKKSCLELWMSITESTLSNYFFMHAYNYYFDRYWDTYPGNLTWDMY